MPPRVPRTVLFAHFTATPSLLLFGHVPPPIQAVRALHATPANSASSPLFALGALSNSRESQYFKKASGLSAVEHSPNLQLIRSSEVVPFARNSKDGDTAASLLKKEDFSSLEGRNANEEAKPYGSSSADNPVTTIELYDTSPEVYGNPDKSAELGRWVLTAHAKEVSGLKRAFAREKLEHEASERELKKENKRLAYEADQAKARGERATVMAAVAVAVIAAWNLVPWKTSKPAAVKSEVGMPKAPKSEATDRSWIVFGENVKRNEPVRKETAPQKTEASAYISIGESRLPIPSFVKKAPVVEVRIEPSRKTSDWRSWFWSEPSQ